MSTHAGESNLDENLTNMYVVLGLCAHMTEGVTTGIISLNELICCFVSKMAMMSAYPLLTESMVV